MANVKMTIDDGTNVQNFILLRKEFSTGSVGYGVAGRVALPDAEGTLVDHTFTLNIVEVGSKKKKK